MAKVSYLDIDVPLQGLYFGGLKQADRFYTSRVVHNSTILSRKRIAGLTARSLLPQIVESWNALSPTEKWQWAMAGFEMELTGYRMFVKDQTLRIKNGLFGTAVPSTLHQALVGNLHVQAPATEIKIIQLHPHTYWVSRKVSGKKGMYVPVRVIEALALPLTISLNFFANLVAAGPLPFAKFYAQVWYSYQGVDCYRYLEIDLNFQTLGGSIYGNSVFGDCFFGETLPNIWYEATAILSEIPGQIIGYSLAIHLHDLQGDLYFDNIKAEHSGQNWVRDTFCNDINQGFTRAFYQVPKHWVADIIPAGADFESIYKDF